MKIIKKDIKWYMAEQTVPNGILTFTLRSFATSRPKAIKKLIKKLS